MQYITEILDRERLLRWAELDNFLDVVERSQQVKDITLVKVGKNKQTMYFKVRSVTTPDQWYATVVKTQEKLDKSGAVDGYLYCRCNCKSFRYWGYHYLLTISDNVWGKGERRYPSIRNGQLKGTVCKHIFAVLSKLPEFVNVLDLETNKNG